MQKYFGNEWVTKPGFHQIWIMSKNVSETDIRCAYSLLGIMLCYVICLATHVTNLRWLDSFQFYDDVWCKYIQSGLIGAFWWVSARKTWLHSNAQELRLSCINPSILWINVPQLILMARYLFSEFLKSDHSLFCTCHYVITALNAVSCFQLVLL